MSGNNIIVISVSIYVLLLLLGLIKFILIKKSYKKDEYNEQLEDQGFFLFIAMFFLIVVGVALPSITFSYYREVTESWIKVYFFLPLVLPFGSILIFIWGLIQSLFSSK